MFRNIAIIGSFLLLLLGMNAEAIQGKNYVKNPDFESGNTGYKYSGTSQGLDRTELGNLDRNGKQSITLTGGSGAFLESDPIKMDKILAGKACSTSIKYLLNSGGGFFTVYSGATTGSMTEINSSLRFPLSIQTTAKTAL